MGTPVGEALRKAVWLLLLLLMLGSFAAAPRKPVDGFAVGLFGGYWIHSGPSYFFDDGYGGSFRTGYRFKGGELELYGFFEYTYLLMTDIWSRWGEDVTGNLMVFGIVPRVSFAPTSWISPYFGAGPAFQLRATSLEIPSGEPFNYRRDAADFAVFVELGAELPIQPMTIIELGFHYVHPFVPEEEHFAGMTFGAGVSLFF
jgi:opacity protein-like surface antigen